MNLVRVLPDVPPQGNAQQIAPTFARVVTPAGKTGFVAIDGISPIGMCNASGNGAIAISSGSRTSSTRSMSF